MCRANEERRTGVKSTLRHSLWKDSGERKISRMTPSFQFDRETFHPWFQWCYKEVRTRMIMSVLEVKVPIQVWSSQPQKTQEESRAFCVLRFAPPSLVPGRDDLGFPLDPSAEQPWSPIRREDASLLLLWWGALAESPQRQRNDWANASIRDPCKQLCRWSLSERISQQSLTSGK